MSEMTDASREKMMADLRLVLTDAEELLRLAATDAGEKFSDVRARMGERVTAARARFTELEGSVLEKARETAKRTDAYVHEHPWESVGVAAGIGLLVGLLIGRR